MANKTKVKTTDEFEKLYLVLNAAQKQAVDTVEGPVMVIAGPGTGKTTILTLRIANILRTTDTAPENILALTFTESGAYAMRRKLLSIIGPAAYKVNIHTFHGFAEDMIQQYPDYFPRVIGSSIITDAEQIKIIEKIIKSKEIKILRPYGDPLYYVKSILNEIHILKRENVSPEELKQSVKKSIKSLPADEEMNETEKDRIRKRDAKNMELASVYAKYEEALARQRYYDFDDMLLELIRSMKDDRIFKLTLQEKYQYILADEHQDANAAQNCILEMLSDFYESPNLFIVGDDKQAIYRFQGASLENFLYFTKKYRDACVIELEHNYRSHQGILDASHSIIINNPAIPGRVPTRLLSLQVGTKPIFVDEFPTPEDELEYISTLIGRLIKKGEKPEEIAVLYRENRESRAVFDALRAHGVVSRVESDHDILEDIDSAKIIILCRAIHDPSNDELLARSLLLPELVCDPADVAEACRLARREGKSLREIIQSRAADEVKEAYGRIKRWAHEGHILPFPDFLQKLIQETNMLGDIAKAPNSLERLTSLEVFFDRMVKAAEAKKTFYLSDFIEYMDIVSEHGIMTKRTSADHAGGVRLMTAHRAKGLEFNHVFIINAVDGIWGNRGRRNLFNIPIIEHARDTGRIEDERRLFYVAMTRARESVNISYARSNGEKETMPSQFISEIDPILVTFEKPVIANTHDYFINKIKTPLGMPSVSILSPEYTRSRFISQPFSVTHLNNYLECPWRYFFVNLIRVPQAQTKHQMYGTAIHAALRSFFDAYKEGRDLSKKQLVDLFRFNLDMQPMSVEDCRESFNKGKESLEGYYREYFGKWPRRLLTEYEIRGVSMPLGMTESDRSLSIQLTGKLDKVEFMDDRNVTVIDYKTSKPKSRNEIEGKTRSSAKNGQGNYKRQLVFYKLLLEGNEKFGMRYAELDFVEPNERGRFKKERFEVSDKEVDELRSEIQRVASEILNLSFIGTACNRKDCEYCMLGKILSLDKGFDKP